MLYLICCKLGGGDGGGNTQKQQLCPYLQLHILTPSLGYAPAIMHSLAYLYVEVFEVNSKKIS